MNKNKEYLFFDLDGTLTDPKIGITKSVQYSLQFFGIDAADPNEFVKFIGPPLRDSYKKYYSLSGDEAEIAVAKYREYFADKSIFENTIYGGIENLLKNQVTKGKKIALATSKPTVYAEKILKYFNIDMYFSFIAGSELNGTRSKKDAVIQYAMENLRITDVNKVIMIGDKEHDIIGANKVGMDSIGVLYGYGGFDELSAAGADYIAADVNELEKVLDESKIKPCESLT